MKKGTMTKSNEDYLEAILVTQRKKGVCRSIDVALHLGVSKPSVTVAMTHLEQMGLVRRDLSQGKALTLTAEGMERAQSVLERHEFVAQVLCALGVPREVAEEDACKIEHDISQTSFDKMRDWYAQHQKQG